MSKKQEDSVDPLERRASYNSLAVSEEHDFSAASTIPDIHINNRSRRSSSIIKPINTLLGIKEAQHQVIDENGEYQDDSSNSKDQSTSQKDNEGTDNSLGNDDEPFKTVQGLERQETIPVKASKDENQLEKVSSTKSNRNLKEKTMHALFGKVALKFTQVYIVMLCFFVGSLSIYWGSLYNRSAYLKNLHYLVVVEETETPLIGETLVSVLNSTTASHYGTFHFYTAETFNTTNNNTILEEVTRRVHHQKYWGGYYVPANATVNFNQALKDADSSYNETSIYFIYETGRNPSAVPGYVVAYVSQLEKVFVKAASANVTPNLLNSFSTDEKTSLVENAPNLLSNFWFNKVDNRPMATSITTGPTTIGLIYLLVLSFHQFNFAATTHELIGKKLRSKQYLVYHIITSQGAYLVISLVYCLMTLAFQIPINKTFGRSGFLVEWAFSYLTIAALGGINENVGLQVFARDRGYIGYWVTSFLVINMSVVFSPIALTNRFYRYGYAVPMYNGHELLKVVFLNTFKGHMGRNIGVLIAWIILCNVILPFNLQSVKKYRRKVEAKAEQAIEQKEDSTS